MSHRSAGSRDQCATIDQPGECLLASVEQLIQQIIKAIANRLYTQC